MTLPSCTKGPVWESEEGRTLSGFRLGLALEIVSLRTRKVKITLWRRPSSVPNRRTRSARFPISVNAARFA